MSTPIGSTSALSYLPPALVQPAKVPAKDTDGDNDGSKAGEVEKPKATSGTVGTQINTSA